MFRARSTPLAQVLALLLGIGVLGAASNASAQRRIVGDDPEEEDEDAKEKAAEEAAKKKREEAEKRKAAEAQKRSEAKKRASEEKKKAAEAAREAAKEAEEKRKAAEEKAAEDAVAKEKARLDGNKEARLMAAKKQRRITRKAGDLVFTMTLVPGAPKPGDVLEVRVDVAQELEVASVTYGKYQPLRGLPLVAEVSPPDTGRDEEAKRYLVHELGVPGAYGFHFTPSREGELPIKIEGKRPKGPPFTVELSVHAGVWPPPDFEGEEANNAKIDVAASGRRVAGGG